MVLQVELGRRLAEARWVELPRYRAVELGLRAQQSQMSAECRGRQVQRELAESSLP